ncbi:hypothetical protein D3C78_893350 [compost metagenome]
MDQRGAGLRQPGHRIAGTLQGTQDIQRRCRGVETDAVADAPVAGRVVGQHQGDALVGVGLARQIDPAPRQLDDEVHALAVGLVADHVALAALAAPGQALEADRPGDDAPVQLGQRHVHGQVARAEALRVVLPALAVVQRADRLQHRHVAAERAQRRALRAGQGKPRGIEDQRRLALVQPGLDLGQAGRLLEAGHRDRQRIEALR